MKIMKSGTLTAFTALALISSHGVHAAPKGRSFGIVSKTLALMKKYPKTSSSSLGALGFGALGVSLYIMHKVTGKKDESPVSAKGSQREGSQEEIEMRQKKAYLMKYMDALISHNDFQKRLGSLVGPIENLKTVVERTFLDKRVLESLSCMMVGLEIFLDTMSTTHKLGLLNNAMIRATESEKSAKGENDLKDALGEFIKPLKTLLEKNFSEAIEEVKSALSQSRSLGTLVTPFESFAGAVRKEFGNLPIGDSGTGTLSSVLMSLKGAAEGLFEGYPEIAIDRLGKITSKPLKNSAQAFKAAIQKVVDELKKNKRRQ